MYHLFHFLLIARLIKTQSSKLREKNKIAIGNKFIISYNFLTHVCDTFKIFTLYFMRNIIYIICVCNFMYVYKIKYII